MKNVCDFTPEMIDDVMSIREAILDLKCSFMLGSKDRRTRYVPLTRKELVCADHLSKAFDHLCEVYSVMSSCVDDM